MAKRAVVVFLVVLLVMLLLPGLGMAMAMAPCPACAIPTSMPIGAMCLVVIGLAILLVAASVARTFPQFLAVRAPGPPGTRLFRPPRSS